MRWLGFALRLILLLALIAWLIDQPGAAQIVWHGYVIETSASVLALVGVGAVFILFSLFRLWRFLLDGPRFWRMRQKIKKIERGQDQLAQGLVAIAAGDGAEAGRLAVGARKLLGPTTTTRLLQAQAAQLSGDHRAAHEIYTALAAEPESAVLGYRGLIMAALREGKWDEAERLAEKLRRLKPDTPWLGLIRFELLVRRQQWNEARLALTSARQAHLLDQTRANRYLAALTLADANNVIQEGKAPGLALSLAEQALRLAPGWLPAVLMLAKQQVHGEHNRAAMKLIERQWVNHPHLELAALYGSINQSSDDPLSAYKQVEKLTRINPEHTTSQMALAKAALDADLWGAARRHLLAIASRPDATQNVFRMLAKLERRESGDDRATARWLMKIGEALPDARWLCQTCGGAHDAWQATCKHCGCFNALEWQIPGMSRIEETKAIAHQPSALLSDIS